MKVTISAPDPEWPLHFARIKSELYSAILFEAGRFKSIEHIGSTAVPGLAAKPIIDIVIVIEDWLALEKIEEGLNLGGAYCRLPSYVRAGDGGVKDRPSFKVMDPSLMPKRNVYVLLGDSIILRAHRDLVRVLSDNNALRDRYAAEKTRLADAAEYEDVMVYAQAKNEIIREILREAGWTKDDIKLKESMAGRNWGPHDET